MKKALSILTAGCLAVSLAACGSTAASSAASAADSTASSAAESTGCSVQSNVLHQLADADLVGLAVSSGGIGSGGGFKDALTEQLGDAVTFEEKNAQGDSNTCSTIINGFVSDNVDLILANATPALQAAQAGTNTIPVLGTSVTEYGVALGIDDFDGLVGTNISGTSDLAPLDEQAGIIKELFPDAKTVGLLYCSAEANSQYQVDTVKASLEELGYTCEYYAFSDSNDLATVCQSAADASDVIYVPTDNTVANNTEIVNNICQPAGVPVVAGEEGIMGGCGVATLSISYYDLGVATGKMAAKILTGESKVEEMPIEYAPKFTKEYNPTIAEALGITIPDDYVAYEG